jgi:hypothetical protein
MKKKDNHINEPANLTRFRSIEEMKSSPFLFPSAKPLAQRQAERMEAFAQLRSAFSANDAHRSKKTNKKRLK